MRSSILVLVALMLMGASTPPTPTNLSNWQQVEDCDIPGGDLDGMSKPDANACQQTCSETKGCAGFTFITGWGRCNLKHTVTKKVTVVMHAAQVLDEEKRTLTAAQERHDHKGKDLETKPRLIKDAAACAVACQAEEACKGYVYIAGYSACWLKKTAGGLRPKQFICGFKP